MVKLGTYARSVSIVGVGCTPFSSYEDDPATKGIGEGEAFGYAALEAMEDCGLSPRDIDFFFHGEANPFQVSACMTPNMQVADWIGMRGKASIHHSEACCTGYVAIEQAAFAIASGAYDTVLTGAVELAASLPVDDTPAHMRGDYPVGEMIAHIGYVYDRAYGRPLDSAFGISFDNWINKYVMDYGLTDDQIDDALCALAKTLRINAVRNPLGFYNETFDEVAAANGMASAEEYLKSMMNPKVTQYLRVSGFETKCDGAAVAILMPTDKARALGLPAVEVLGSGAAAYEGALLQNEYSGTRDATAQVYGLTGVSPDEIDLMYVNDFFMGGDICAPEEVGYIPRGEAWQYAIDGRMGYDGDKPVNPNGGRCNFGHAHGASGLADVYDAVHQMRGAAGATQVKKIPETVFLRGFGGGQNIRCQILRTVR